MKQLRIRLFTVFVSTQLLYSCTYNMDPYNVPIDRQRQNIYYVPSSSNAILLKNKNDVRLNVNFSPGSNHETVEVQGAFAPIKNVGLMANLSTNSANNKIKLSTTTLGIGYMKNFSNMWLLETYVGVNSGMLENEHVTGRSKFKINQQFIQPSLAISNDKNNQIITFTSRFTTVQYHFRDSTFNNDREKYSSGQIRTLVNNPNHFFWEPGFGLRYGWPKFVFNMNYTQSVHIGKADFRRDQGNFSIGATLQLNASKK